MYTVALALPTSQWKNGKNIKRYAWVCAHVRGWANEWACVCPSLCLRPTPRTLCWPCALPPPCAKTGKVWKRPQECWKVAMKISNAKAENRLRRGTRTGTNRCAHKSNLSQPNLTWPPTQTVRKSAALELGIGRDNQPLKSWKTHTALIQKSAANNRN